MSTRGIAFTILCGDADLTCLWRSDSPGGTVVTGELQPDGKVRWSDGDTWVRKEEEKAFRSRTRAAVVQ